MDSLSLTTLALEVTDGVATVTLDRPQVHNAFDSAMTSELAQLWKALRSAPEVRAVVVTGRGDKAFCTGIDRSSVEEFGLDPFTYEDPGRLIGPKSAELWKPVVAAVNGGLLTVDEACARYTLSLEEFASWQRAVDRSGMPGLRVTRIQHYKSLYERQQKF